jgi:predicted phosphodiesterase
MPKSYEDELQLLIDKVEGVDDRSWEEMVDELGLSIHPDSLRKSFNGGRYSGYNICKHYQEKFENEYCSQEEIDRLELLKKELIKEKVKVSDAKREYRKHLTNEARYENLVDVFSREIQLLEPIEFHYTNENKNSGINAALLISDIHYGNTTDNVLNYYDTNIAKERIQQLLDKTIYYCSSNRVQTLYINLLGDLIAGNIHTSVRVEQEEDVVSQIINVAEILSNFIAEISKYVPNIKVVCVQGNHGRTMSNLKENLNKENYERLIYEYIRLRLPELSIITNGFEDWATYDINGRKIFIEHGDKTKIEQIKQKAINLLGYVPDDIFVGHYHRMEMLDDNNTEVVINGSILSTDSYAMNHRLNTKPHQILRIYNDEDVCTYRLNLD